jgi:hypothetical protein
MAVVIFPLAGFGGWSSDSMRDEERNNQIRNLEKEFKATSLGKYENSIYVETNIDNVYESSKKYNIVIIDNIEIEKLFVRQPILEKLRTDKRKIKVYSYTILNPEDLDHREEYRNRISTKNADKIFIPENVYSTNRGDYLLTFSSVRKIANEELEFKGLSPKQIREAVKNAQKLGTLQKPTGNLEVDFFMAITFRMEVEIHYTSSNTKQKKEIPTGKRVVEPVALGIANSKFDGAGKKVIRIWQKTGDTLTPKNKPGWRFMYLDGIKSLKFTGKYFNYKRPSFNSSGDEFMTGRIIIASFGETRIYGKGRRAGIITSVVKKLVLELASLEGTSSGRSELRKKDIVERLQEIKSLHENKIKVLGYEDRDLIYKILP